MIAENKIMNNNEVIIHGECMVFKSAIPAKAKKMKTASKPYVIVAPSETTGNHHVVDLKPGVAFYEYEDVLYMENDVETTIRCVVQDRHDEITLAPGVYEFGSQQEYDPFTARLQKVRD